MSPQRTILAVSVIWGAPINVKASAVDSDAGRPIVQTCRAAEIQAKGPILSFAETTSETVFVGSNSLSVSDGHRWQPVDIPGAYGFRSLAADQDMAGHDRVWVGATGAVGYMERNGLGNWSFLSLRGALPPSVDAPALEIQLVTPSGAGAIFVAAHRVLRWDGTHFRDWTLPSAGKLQAFPGDPGEVWVYREEAGMVRITGAGDPIFMRGRNTLPPGKLGWIVRSDHRASAEHAEAGAGAIVGTSNGAYVLTAEGFWRLPRISAAIEGMGSIHGIALDDDTIAISTDRNGVLLATREDQVVARITQAEGLGDKTIYCLWRNLHGNLWMGWGQGCARLEGIGRASVFASSDGLSEGLPRKVFPAFNFTHVLTDQALYRIDPGASGTSRIARVATLPARLVDTIAGAHGLWTGSAAGLSLAEREDGPSVSVDPTPIAALAAAPWLSGGLLYAVGGELRAALPGMHSDWTRHTFLSPLPSAVTSLICDGNGELWVATSSDGIFRFAAAKRNGSSFPDLHVVGHYPTGSGFPSSGADCHLVIAGGRICAFSSGVVLEFKSGQGFLPAPAFSGWTAVAATRPQLPASDQTAQTRADYWVARRLTPMDDSAPYALLRIVHSRSDGSLEWEPQTAPGLDGIGEITSVDTLNWAGRRILWIGGKGGLLRLETSASKAVDPPLKLTVTGMRSDGTLHELQHHDAIAIGPRPTRVEFDFWAGEPLELGPGTFFQTRLAGIESDWSPPQRKSSREFTGLAPGSYVFMARRLDRFGRAGPVEAYPFAVRASWYQRWPAYFCYLLSAVLITVWALEWRLRLLKRRAESLDRIIAQRTHELETSKRELELSNTAKSEFLENISHEIRNPLNGIVGLTALLEKEGLPERPQAHARSLKECSATLVKVFNEVLNFSQLEYGYATLHERFFLLGEVVAAVCSLFSPLAEQQGGTIRTRFPSDLKDGFWGDDAKLRTILDNFVSNALRYAPGTPITLTVACEDISAEAADVLIEVSDEGPGVPAAEQDLIFKKFVRSRQAKASGVPGTGIGLATCDATARLLGGSVGIESPVAAGMGASFFVSLTLVRAEPPAQGTALPPPREDPLDRNLSALIVDDQSYNQVVLANIVSDLGYASVCAGSAEEALDIFAAGSFRIVFIDSELPGIKGPELARQLRQQPGGRMLLLIGISASASREAAERALAAGMDGFLIKPISLNAIRESLRNALARGRTDGESEERVPGLPARPEIPLHQGDFGAFGRYAQTLPGGLPEAVQRYRAILRLELDALMTEAAHSIRPDVIAAAAHRLNSHASILGRNALCDAAWTLEEAARASAVDQFPDLLGKVAAAVEELEQFIAGQLSGTPPEPAQIPSPERSE